jgi:hypothetical protein
MNFMRPEELKREFEAAGFRVILASYLNREGQFPASVIFDGRESAWIVAEK